MAVEARSRVSAETAARLHGLLLTVVAVGLLLVVSVSALAAGVGSPAVAVLFLSLCLSVVACQALLENSMWPFVIAAIVFALFIDCSLGIFLSSPTPAQWLLGMFEAKTLIIVAGALAGVIILSRGRFWDDRTLRYALLALAALAVLAVVELFRQAGTLIGGVAYVRNFSAPFLILALAMAAGQERRAVDTLHGALLALSALLIVGVVAELIVGIPLWTSVFHVSALEIVKGPISSVTQYFGQFRERVGGFVLEPVNASYAYASLAVYFLSRRAFLLSAALLACDLLTAAKGGLLVGAIAVGWMIACRRIKGARDTVLAALVMLLLAFPALIAYLAVSGQGIDATALLNPMTVYLSHDTSLTHSSGLLLGLGQVINHPFGVGTGGGGNFGTIFDPFQTQEQWISSGAESAVGSLAFQLGIPGLLLFTTGVFGIFASIGAARNNPATNTQSALLMPCGLFLGWTCSTLFQENAFGPQAAVVPLVIVGVHLTAVRRDVYAP